MIYYICERCDEPAFYLKYRPNNMEPLDNSNIYSNGNGIDVFLPQYNHGQCQSCRYLFNAYDPNRVMDNLEYIEYLAKQRNLV
jgi:hypothetical protein